MRIASSFFSPFEIMCIASSFFSPYEILCVLHLHFFPAAPGDDDNAYPARALTLSAAALVEAHLRTAPTMIEPFRLTSAEETFALRGQIRPVFAGLGWAAATLLHLLFGEAACAPYTELLRSKGM